MAKKKDHEADLFKDAPEHVKKLHREAKKLRRDKNRKDWKSRNDPNFK